MKKIIYWTISIFSVTSIYISISTKKETQSNTYFDTFSKVKKLLKERKPRVIKLKQLKALTVQEQEIKKRKKIDPQNSWSNQSIVKKQIKLVNKKVKKGKTLESHLNAGIVRFDFPSQGKTWQTNWYIMVDFLTLGQKEFENLYLPILEKYDFSLDEQYYQQMMWQEVYSIFASFNYKRLSNIAWAFEYFRDNNILSIYDTTQLVLSFVQSIGYFVPKNNFGFYLPQKMLSLNKGDCDSKALLMVIILRKLGINAIIFHSIYYKHAMVGVEIRSLGKYKKFRNKKYYFAETTNLGFRVGQLAPKVGDIKKWKALPISFSY